MSTTITTDVEIEVELDDIIDDVSTEELLYAVEERFEKERERHDFIDMLLKDAQCSSENTRYFIERLCAPRGGSYIDKATAKRIICELIDEVFFEV